MSCGVLMSAQVESSYAAPACGGFTSGSAGAGVGGGVGGMFTSFPVMRSAFTFEEHSVFE